MRGGSLHVPTRRSACLQAPTLIGILATLLMPFYGLGGLVVLVAVIILQRSTAKDVQSTAAGQQQCQHHEKGLLLASWRATQR